ncbi:MAG: hypothetical protein JXQ73_12690 [Phycisphaerae bacterium]|nr:hypothetical protein [Phycisphaerae bacterium]
MRNVSAVALLALLAGASSRASALPGVENLLVNSSFDFHAFNNHRLGERECFSSNNVAFWNTDAWGDVTVVRESHVDAKIRPAFCAHNLVSISPGKRFWQFFSLPEAGLAHGERISLVAFGHQTAPKALRARLEIMKLDSEDGTWRPADFGMGDKRTFPKHARGELVVAKRYEAASDKTGTVELRIDGAEIIGRFHEGNASRSDDVNTIGVRVEFRNASDKDPVWVYAPCLRGADKALPRLPERRMKVAYYRHIPRTIQKLWKGQAIHVLVMGSSIDRGSANPPMYLYDEDPDSPKFKQPLSERTFEPRRVDRPDLEGYVGWWQHYFSYSGRLRLELMRKFNLPVEKICLNVMACDGSCVGEAHSGLADYCGLRLPPDPGGNGHQHGKRWDELYPELFARPEGPGPDLVIFGSGANEKTDTPDEVAVFEGAIRWIQRHYPHCEFLFCMFQNAGAYTPNTGDLQALSLRYQIPFLDYGRVADEVTRWCNRFALVPADGHPQAACHYLWFKQLEKAFECWDPVLPGQAQRQLPERAHANTYGWEGDVITCDAKSGRLKGGKFVFEDTAVNCWAKIGKDAGQGDKAKPEPYVDGVKFDTRYGMAARDIRNSTFRHGRCRLGDRHVLEIANPGAKLVCVDAKVCPDRRYLGVNDPRWRLGGAEVVEFKSEWGAPYGARQVMLSPGKAIGIDAVCTDVSVAYVDAPKAGTLKVSVDGVERLVQPANVPFLDVAKGEHFMENRKGILGLGFGLHVIRVEAVGAPVGVLGVFTYDSRSNRRLERRLIGQAAAGQTVSFSLPFKVRPMVICHGGLAVQTEDITRRNVTFSGRGVGGYEVIGE